jgi:streptogramin lyase
MMVTPASRLALDWVADGGPNPLGLPIAVALDRHGDLYVVDADYQRLRVFDRDGRPVRAWGGPGSDDGQFRFRDDRCHDGTDTCGPIGGGGVAVDGQDRVYIADFGNHRVQVFDRDGRLLARWGREGSGPGELRWPHGIAIDGQGRVYVADKENHRIQQFDGAGRFLAAWGSEGAGPGQFDRPSMVAADGQGRVYAADGWHPRLQQFDGRGRFVAAWAMSGPSAVAVKRVAGLAVDRLGRVYASDTAGRVHWFTPEGQVLATWDPGQRRGAGWLGVAGLAVDANDGLYVAAAVTGRVAKYVLLAPVTG